MRIRYFHPAFIDSAQALMNEFKDDTSNTLLILGLNAALYFGYDYDSVIKGYDKVIIYNQENFTLIKDMPWFGGFIDILRRADAVWEYAESNLPRMHELGITATHHILKPYMDWSKFATVDKDIDFLLYGSLTRYRMDVVNFLRKKYNVVTLTGEVTETLLEGVYGSVLDNYILRSKVLLNVHSGPDQKEQEYARMVKWIGAPCQIISERSLTNYLNVPEMDYWELFTL